MINDLSTLSRAERGVADETGIIDVTELAAQIKFRIFTSGERKEGLAFNLDIGGRLGVVKVSRLYLEEILQNFITNAIRIYTKALHNLSIKKIPGEITSRYTELALAKPTWQNFRQVYRVKIIEPARRKAQD